MRNKLGAIGQPPRLVFLLNVAQRRLQQWLTQLQEADTEAGALAPTATQGGVIFILDKEDGATMGYLARRLDLAPSAVSGLVQRMEQRGWVVRRGSEEDGRTQKVFLLDAGKSEVLRLKQSLKRVNEALTQGFTAAELETVARWLEHVRNLEQPTEGEREIG